MSIKASIDIINSLNKFIEDNLTLFSAIDNPTTYERGLCDAYVNIKKQFKNATASSKVLADEQADIIAGLYYSFKDITNLSNRQSDALNDAKENLKL